MVLTLGVQSVCTCAVDWGMAGDAYDTNVYIDLDGTGFGMRRVLAA